MGAIYCKHGIYAVLRTHAMPPPWGGDVWLYDENFGIYTVPIVALESYNTAIVVALESYNTGKNHIRLVQTQERISLEQSLIYHPSEKIVDNSTIWIILVFKIRN